MSSILVKSRKSLISSMLGASMLVGGTLAVEQRAQAIIMGVSVGDDDLVRSGLWLTFSIVLAPVGLILAHSDQSKQEIYQQLPFLRGTSEGRAVWQMIRNRLAAHSHQVQQATRNLPRQQAEQAAQRILSQQSDLRLNVQTRQLSVRLNQQQVRQTLQKRFNQHQVQQAVRVLCQQF